MNAWKHFKTITHHRHLVCLGCFRVGLYWQGLTHDLSKYSLTEFRQGVRYFQGDRSPNDAERKDRGYSSAWLHHKGRNKHHFEYWIDYSLDGTGTLVGMKMPDKYIVAASGMAGFSSANTIKTRKVSSHFYLCGDGISDIDMGEGLVSSRVMVCAAHQAHMVLRILTRTYEA